MCRELTGYSLVQNAPQADGYGKFSNPRRIPELLLGAHGEETLVWRSRYRPITPHRFAKKRSTLNELNAANCEKFPSIWGKRRIGLPDVAAVKAR